MCGVGPWRLAGGEIGADQPDARLDEPGRQHDGALQRRGGLARLALLGLGATRG